MLLRILGAVLLVLFGKLSVAQHTVFLIGDAGEPYIKNSTLGAVLKRQVDSLQQHATILFLGDNIYPSGLPPLHEKHGAEAANILTMQLQWVSQLDATTIFIPGNHDWANGRRKGLQRILQQQQFIDSAGLQHVTFFPRDGCPGPEEIVLTANTTLVIIDSQWFLHPWEKPEAESSCESKSPLEVLSQLRDILVRNKHKRVIVAAHHPLITYGEHGGVFTLRDHLFPLTEVNKALYIPLPGIGSIYPVYRKWFGNIQDTPHPKYKQYSEAMQQLLREFPGSLYVAGHEHALEYIEKDSTSMIVSGSGAKTSVVRAKDFAQFAAGVTGFARIDIAPDGSQQLSFYQVDATFPTGKLCFRKQLETPHRMRTANEQHPEERSFPTMVRVKASTQYEASPRKERWLGKNYRDVWNTEVDVPVLDMATEQGGLKIIQRGGGMQTLSLRLQDSIGREWVIRSIEKYPEHAVPENLRKTFAQDLVQDQISASHPYAALVLPPLAHAAGIYHTNPRVMYLPDDPLLGDYRADFANRLVLFEERPDGDASALKHFGNAKKIISTTKLLERLQKDNDHRVDQEFVVRSRLFDIWIGDWDRHDDQWRWALVDSKGKQEVYRPIPRDRDQAFFMNEGRLPKVWSRKWALPKFEGFDESINWVSGFSFNARYFDRSFLNGLSREQWIEQAKALQQQLTDDVIDSAMLAWPESIRVLHAEKITRALKRRRDDLVRYANDHYSFLAREVDVAISDKGEWFDIRHDNGGSVSVVVYDRTKAGERGKKLYDRTFLPNETKEIRLYGLGGDDRFEVKSSERSAIRVRIIGGTGQDEIVTEPKGTKTIVYDSKETSISGKVINRTASDPDVNVYDRKAFQYNRLAPLIYGNFNPDDGLFAGGGVLFQQHGFRKSPFKQRHILLASVAPLTNSYNILYRADFTAAIGKWDWSVNADIKSPNFVNNFFGLGNETKFDRSIDDQPGINANRAIDYYRFRFEEIRFETFLSRSIGSNMKVRIGPSYQQIEIEQPDDTDRYIDQVYAPTLSYNLYEEYNRYLGLHTQFTIDKRDSELLTLRGLLLNAAVQQMRALTDNGNDFTAFNGSIAFYQSFRLPARVTFAVRAGAGHTTSGYNFYQAQILDGKTELRGFRKTRFYGDTELFFNNELRLKLFSMRSYLFPATVGLNVFYDTGRVWYKDENGIDPSAANGHSTYWHKGYGGGVWFTPFNMTVLATELSHSVDGYMVYVRLGFLF